MIRLLNYYDYMPDSHNDYTRMCESSTVMLQVYEKRTDYRAIKSLHQNMLIVVSQN